MLIAERNDIKEKSGKKRREGSTKRPTGNLEHLYFGMSTFHDIEHQAARKPLVDVDSIGLLEH